MIYTPQMIIGGQAHVEGVKPMQMMDSIREMQSAYEDIDVSLKRKGNQVTVRVHKVDLEGPVQVQFVRYVRNAR